MDMVSLITGLSHLCTVNHISEPLFAKALSCTATVDFSLEKLLFPPPTIGVYFLLV